MLFKNFLVLQFICLFLPFLFQDIICDVIISVIHFSKFLEFIPLIATAFSLYTALNKENKTSTPPKKKAKTKRKIKPLLAHRRLAIRVFKLYATIDPVLAHKILPAEISTHFIPTPAQHYSSTLCLFGGCLLWDSWLRPSVARRPTFPSAKCTFAISGPSVILLAELLLVMKKFFFYRKRFRLISTGYVFNSKWKNYKRCCYDQTIFRSSIIRPLSAQF